MTIVDALAPLLADPLLLTAAAAGGVLLLLALVFLRRRPPELSAQARADARSDADDWGVSR